jgi:antitoxin component of MazEF toxin-antitoxin module
MSYSKPVRLRVQGGGLGVTVPQKLVREMGLAAGDSVLFKREPDGLRMRIIQHSKLVELALAQDAEETVAAQ